MGPRPDRSHYLAEQDYSEALIRWITIRDRLEAERLRMMPNIGSITDTLEGTFTITNAQTPPFTSETYSQWRARNGESWEEEEPLEVEEIAMDKIEKIMKERHLTKAERQALHKPKSDWIEGRKGEECRAACELKVNDLVPSTLRVKKKSR